MTDTTSQETHLHNWLKTKRSEIENLLKRRYFFRPAFEIYGGVSGLYDYGPTGCSMKRELEDFWRRHFILEEDMLEFSGTNITPESVLQASGHVEKFSDFMVKEEGTGICFRADKYLEQFIEEKIKEANLTEEQKKELEIISNSADSYSAEELHQIYVRFEIKSPQGNSLSYPEPFNLMFSTMIGPTGTFKGYLRPETA